MVSKKTKRARLNPGELVYTFYFKLQHNSIISPENSDGNDDAYDVTYYSYFCLFRAANIRTKNYYPNLMNKISMKIINTSVITEQLNLILKQIQSYQSMLPPSSQQTLLMLPFP